MATIRKVVITAFGDESKLVVVEAEMPEPKAGEVQVGVEYSVVAGSDVNMRRGVYPLQKKAPLTPGYSVLGRVMANGGGCQKFRVGDVVVCLSKYEGQAERVNLPERFLVAVPEVVDRKQAVALVLDWVTAYEMLCRSAKVKAGQRIFVHGLSGGVGMALLVLGRVMGLEVLGTASAGKHEELRRMGAEPFEYRTKDWIGAVQERGGVDAVFDALGYESFEESYRVLRRGWDFGGVWVESAGSDGGAAARGVAGDLAVVCEESAALAGKADYVFWVEPEVEALYGGFGAAVAVVEGGKDWGADQGDVQVGGDSGGAPGI